MIFTVNNDSSDATVYIDQLRYYNSDDNSYEVFIDSDGNTNIKPTGDLLLGDGQFDNASSNTDAYITGNLEVDGTIYGTIANADEIHDADNDTKVQVEESTDEDYIRFDTAGTERMVIDNSGKVGIGTSSPGSALDVNGAAAISGELNVSGAAALASTLAVTDNVTLSSDLAVNGGDITSSASALNIRPADSGSVNITDGTNTLMSITDVGTVGNATLTGALTVEGNTTLGDAGDDNITINASTVSLSNNLNIASNTLYIDSISKRIGIGESSPATDMEITQSLSQALTGVLSINSGDTAVTGNGTAFTTELEEELIYENNDIDEEIQNTEDKIEKRLKQKVYRRDMKEFHKAEEGADKKEYVIKKVIERVIFLGFIFNSTLSSIGEYFIYSVCLIFFRVPSSLRNPGYSKLTV